MAMMGRDFGEQPDLLPGSDDDYEIESDSA